MPAFLALRLNFYLHWRMENPACGGDHRGYLDRSDSGVYFARVRRVFFGEISAVVQEAAVTDISFKDKFVIVMLSVVMIAIGISRL
jgi:hypothetical protein